VLFRSARKSVIAGIFPRAALESWKRVQGGSFCWPLASQGQRLGGRRVGPSKNSDPVLSRKAAPHEASRYMQGDGRSKRTPLGTLRKTRSQIELSMWRGEPWRGRDDQAFELGESGVVAGATANSLAADRHGPRQDGQIAETKLPAGNCSRILDQSLGST
jgi:hypothetical protein